VYNDSLPRLARHAHPEKDLRHVMEITGSTDDRTFIYHPLRMRNGETGLLNPVIQEW